MALLHIGTRGNTDLFFTNGVKFPELQKTDRSFYNCLLRRAMVPSKT
jgi:hypothetical protein